MILSLPKRTLLFYCQWSCACLASFVLSPAHALDNFKKALPGYSFQFPRDHASHDQFKTEWWYFTGHLKSAAGRQYGYELTFFRTGTEQRPKADLGSPWNLDNVYLAHFAITDIDQKRFRFYEKVNRKGLKLANARQDLFSVSNENWSAELLGDKFVLKADGKEYALSLALTTLKQPTIHGIDGVSQKATGVGCASHYYSMTRLKSEGILYLNGHAEAVTGESWMDHEFGSSQLAADQVGWDWFSIQLEDNTELMLYLMRKTKGLDKHSAGTFVTTGGSSRHLSLSDFNIESTGSWNSEKSGGNYPSGWKIKVPGQAVELTVTPVLKDQELITTRSTRVTYWEGAVIVSGFVKNKAVSGRGYVELTGYDRRFEKRI